MVVCRMFETSIDVVLIGRDMLQDDGQSWYGTSIAGH